MESKFKVGDLVWAKMKGFQAWPAKIIQAKTEVKRPASKKNHHFVFFFGSENYAWVPAETIFSYLGHKERFMLSSRVPSGFKEAVEAIEDAVKALPEAARQEFKERLERWDQMAVTADNVRKSEGDVKKRSRASSQNGEPRSDSTEKPKKRKRRKTNDESASADTSDTPSKEKMESPSPAKKRPLKAVSALTPSQKIVKKAKAVAKVAASPNLSNTASPQRSPAKSPTKSPGQLSGSTTKLKPRKIPDLRATASDLSPMDPDIGSSLSSLSANIATAGVGTQIEEGLLVTKPPIKSVIPTPMRIGFLGLGIMGQGMVMNLLRSGHEVTVWNRTSIKCREFVKAGALKGNSPSEVVEACDITFCCVADTTAVKDIVFGSTGVLQGISPGKCYVEMSTIDEDTVQDVAEAVQARGGVYLEAPVVGSRVPALEGQLTILASGDRKLFDDCFSCFEAVGKKSLYLGPEPGAATRMKLIVNMVMGTVIASLSEGMAMAEKVGLDQEDVAEVLSLGSLNCPTIVHKSQAILNQKYDPHFPLQHQQKDLRLALQIGDKVEQPLYVAAAANELYKKARRLGYGDSDTSAVFRAASN